MIPSRFTAGAAILLLSIHPGVRAAGPATIDVATRARAIRPGELVALTITVPSNAPPRVRVFDRDVPAYRVAARVWRALVGIDLAARPGRYAVAIDAGPAGRRVVPLAVGRRVFPTRRLTVDPSFVTPPRSVEARIAEEARLLGATWSSPAGERLWSSPFLRPVPQAANSAFGTRSIFNGVPRSPHTGADFMSPAGTPIQAPNAGRVRIARALYFSGNTVVIDHGLGLFSLLAHLSVIDVHEGDPVARGQVIGLVGATGRVTGPHLHWAVRANGARLDPLSVLAVLGGSAAGS